MSERRSARSKQSIDYSKFGGSEVDFDDDDFVDSTPPIGKKLKHSKDTKGQKKSKKDEKSKSGKTSEETGKSRKRSDRVSLDDKLYERDLQAALQLSQLEYKGDTPSAENRDVKESSETVQNDGEKITNSEQVSNDTPVITEAADKGKTNSALEDLDKIEVLEVGIEAESPSSKKRKRPSKQDADWALESDSDGGRRKRKAATQAVKKWAAGDSDEEGDSSDDDFKVEEDVKLESEDSANADSDNGGDSDFEIGGNNKRGGKTKSRGRGGASSSSRPTPKPRLTATVPVVNKGRGKSTSKLTPGITSTVLPPVRHPAVIGVGKPSPGGSVEIRKPTWMGTALGGVNVKSPGGGGLRLGLSRKARVKSLHPSVHA